MTGGERIGSYRVVRELGRDSLSVMLLAIDERLERPVALRIVQLSPVFLPAQVEASREEFRRLARVAARVTHPNLVTVYAFEPLGTTDLIVTEFVEGETVRERIDRGYRISAVDAARVGVHLADALAAAHDAGLAHGRINASNILVQLDGRHRILDLGMPKLVLGLGSVQAGDPSDDVAALAGVLVALVNGSDPWEARTREGARAARHPITDDFAARAELGAVAPVLRRALRLDATAGYADGAAFRGALRAALEAAARPQPQPADDAVRAVPLTAPATLAAAPLDDEEPSATRLILPIGVESTERVRPDAPVPWRAAAALAAVVFLGVLGFFGVRQLFGPDEVLEAGLTAAAPGGSLAALEPTPDARLDDTADGERRAVSPRAPDAADPPGLRPRSGGTDPSARPADDRSAAGPAASGSPDIRSAAVDVVPAGTILYVRGRSGIAEYGDGSRLTVAAGDSLIVDVAREGYLPERRVFRGEPLTIRMQPDSVLARFVTNVPADVFLVRSSGAVRLGTTDLDVRLPTGRHRIRFRVAGFNDWESEQLMATAGRTYRVAKTDYAAFGSILATVPGGWAWISLDGERERESPVEFQDVVAGRHVVRVRRDGFVTVVDTIDVEAGSTVRRRYELRPRG